MSATGWDWSPYGSAYDVLLETVAATTGVFLALYFTAVSAIAATVYAAVPHDIRTLIIRDRTGEHGAVRTLAGRARGG